MALLEVSGLTQRFGGLTAVADNSFEIQEKEVVGLIGPNGSGKSTIFNCITGFLRPSAGAIRFQGVEIGGREPSFICRQGIACTFQKAIPLANISVRECILIGAYGRFKKSLPARRKADEILSYLGLDRKGEYRVSELNMFDRKRVEMGMALSTEPRLLLLDEICGGLNPAEVEEVLRMIRGVNEKGVALFIVEHVMQAIMKVSHRIIVIHHGQKIASGVPEEIVRNPEVINAYLGEKFRGA